MTDIVTAAIEDTREELSAAILLALHNTARDVSLASLRFAFSAKSPAAIREALGITPDGTDWPALHTRLEFALHSVLAPVLDSVAIATIREHGGQHSDARDALEPAYNATVQTLLAHLLADTLTGTNHAITLALQAPSFIPDDLLPAIGLTDKQVTLLFAARQALAKMRTALTSATTDKARTDTANQFLAKLPAMVARYVRKDIQAMLRATTRRVPQPLPSDLAAKLLRHRITPTATFNVSLIANLAQDRVRVRAQQLGLIPADMRKRWVTMHDERVRHSHLKIEAMNSEGVPLDGAFATPFGFDIRIPPAERNCRCRVTLFRPPA